ncbi:hypothetical protein ONZ45_g17777 [Pleurotus djamor]|nr:hypothetical protein ONZ45_g17777 [Pleurotus djamor]
MMSGLTLNQMHTLARHINHELLNTSIVEVVDSESAQFCERNLERVLELDEQVVCLVKLTFDLRNGSAIQEAEFINSARSIMALSQQAKRLTERLSSSLASWHWKTVEKTAAVDGHETVYYVAMETWISLIAPAVAARSDQSQWGKVLSDMEGKEQSFYSPILRARRILLPVFHQERFVLIEYVLDQESVYVHDIGHTQEPLEVTYRDYVDALLVFRRQLSEKYLKVSFKSPKPVILEGQILCLRTFDRTGIFTVAIARYLLGCSV